MANKPLSSARSPADPHHQGREHRGKHSGQMVHRTNPGGRPGREGTDPLAQQHDRRPVASPRPHAGRATTQQDVRPQGRRRTIPDHRRVDQVDRAFVDPARSKITFGEVAQMWTSSKVGLRASTRSVYGSVIEQHVLPRWRHVPLDAIDHEDVQAWVGDLAGEAALRCPHPKDRGSGLRRGARICGPLETTDGQSGHGDRDAESAIETQTVSDRRTGRGHGRGRGAPRAGTAPDGIRRRLRPVSTRRLRPRLLRVALVRDRVRFASAISTSPNGG